MRRLTALALAGLLTVGLSSPAFAQGNRPPVPPGHQHVPVCIPQTDATGMVVGYELANPSSRGAANILAHVPGALVASPVAPFCPLLPVPGTE